MNVGKSPGIIREVRGELVLDRLPWRRRFTYSKVVPAELIVREGQQTDDISFPFNRNLTVDEINYLGVGTVQFCFFGYVKYTDTFHQLHTKAFAFRIYTRPRDRGAFSSACAGAASAASRQNAKAIFAATAQMSTPPRRRAA